MSRWAAEWAGHIQHERQASMHPCLIQCTHLWPDWETIPCSSRPVLQMCIQVVRLAACMQMMRRINAGGQLLAVGVTAPGQLSVAGSISHDRCAHVQPMCRMQPASQAVRAGIIRPVWQLCVEATRIACMLMAWRMMHTCASMCMQQTLFERKSGRLVQHTGQWSATVHAAAPLWLLPALHRGLSVCHACVRHALNPAGPAAAIGWSASSCRCHHTYVRKPALRPHQAHRRCGRVWRRRLAPPSKGVSGGARMHARMVRPAGLHPPTTPSPPAPMGQRQCPRWLRCQLLTRQWAALHNYSECRWACVKYSIFNGLA